ncbi:armadillo-type protein [Catenaria anguillulae PL171]|uniref:Armadillo-type protein n=1 Tax=Catenaria anguillulae PL171 TaxID=765915 RepID=A0A1Y2I807_9FUNG|nr:armadillo-type protein [Catenaria anguillulae PL171]
MQSTEFYGAVNTFYCATDEVTRQSAAKWLEDFERKDEAWNVALTVLTAPPGQSNSSDPARIFASQVIRHKVVRDLYKLPEEHVTQLRNTILDTLTSPAHPLLTPIVTQLCLALAEMAIHVQSWQNPVGEVLNKCNERAELLSVLLEFLTVLPQELLNAEHILTREEYLERNSSLLEANSQLVFHSLVQFLQSPQAQSSAQLKAKLFVCLESWFETHTIPLTSIAQSPIIPISFEGLTNDDLVQPAATILSAIFDHAEPDITHQTQEGTTVLTTAMPLLLRNCPALIQDASDDEDRAKAMVKLITAVCQACLGPILESPAQYAGLLDLMLSVMAYPFLEVLNPTFDFWAHLTHSVLSEDGPRAYDSAPLLPAFQRLVGILIRQLQYPPENENGEWTAKDRDDFRDFRHYMGDVLKDCFSVLGSDTVLSQLVGMVAQFQQLPPADQQARWPELEAVLYALRSVAYQAINFGSPYVPQIINLLPAMFNLNIHTRRAVLILIGCYSPWVESNPEYLSGLMGLVSQGFNQNDHECTWASSRTLRFLASDLAPIMHQYLDQLYPFYMSHLNTLNATEALEVIEAVSHIIAHSPYEQMSPLMQRFAAPLVEQLEPTYPIQQVKLALYRLAVMVKTVQPDVAASAMHPVLALTDALWPFFVRLLAVHAREDPVTEGIAKVLRNTLNKSMVTHFQPAQVQRMLDLISSQYAETQFSCWLWVGTHVIDYFGKDPQWVAQVLPFVQNVAQSTANMANAQGWDAAYEQIDEMHGMLCAVLNTLPVQFLSWWPTIEQLMRFTLESLHHSTYPRTVGSLLYYLKFLVDTAHPMHHEHYARMGLDNTQVRDRLIRPVGQQLLGLLLVKRIADCVNSEAFKDLLSTIRGLAETFPDVYPTWCASCLAGMSFLSPAERQLIQTYFESVLPGVNGESTTHRVREGLHKMVQLHQRRTGSKDDDKSSRRRR